jgi:hypothetical protein
MNLWTMFWLVIFACAAALFFGTALVISVVGFRDLRDLLSTTAKTPRTSPPPTPPPPSRFP